jgi:hypothetical protein
MSVHDSKVGWAVAEVKRAGVYSFLKKRTLVRS